MNTCKHTATRYGNRYLYRGVWIKKIGSGRVWSTWGGTVTPALVGDTLKTVKEKIDYLFDNRN